MIGHHHHRVEILVKTGDHCDQNGPRVLVTNHGGDPFFVPNGVPLVPKWPIGGHHHRRVEILVKTGDHCDQNCP